MSGVTFKDLYCDYVNIDTSVEDCKKVQPIEIVPRKMVEMIIEDCEKRMEFYGTLRMVCAEDKGAYNTAKSIKEYAESLLKQFEEDE